MPAGFGERALLKPLPAERRLPLRWAQRSVPGGALETAGLRRMRNGGWLPVQQPGGTLPRRAPDVNREEDRAGLNASNRDKRSPRSGIVGRSLRLGSGGAREGSSGTISSCPPDAERGVRRPVADRHELLAVRGVEVTEAASCGCGRAVARRLVSVRFDAGLALLGVGGWLPGLDALDWAAGLDS